MTYQAGASREGFQGEMEKGSALSQRLNEIDRELDAEQDPVRRAELSRERREIEQELQRSNESAYGMSEELYPNEESSPTQSPETGDGMRTKPPPSSRGQRERVESEPSEIEDPDVDADDPTTADPREQTYGAFHKIRNGEEMTEEELRYWAAQRKQGEDPWWDYWNTRYNDLRGVNDPGAGRRQEA
jgi:hypothetical protein